MQLLCGDSYWRGERGTGTTRRFRSALLGSLLFHCTLGGLATAVVLKKPALQEPVVIDLTTVSLPPTEQEQLAPAAQRSQQRAMRPIGRQAPVAAEKIPAPSATPVSTSAAIAEQKAAESASGGQSAAATASNGAGAKGVAAGTETRGTGSTAALPETQEKLQKRYLREHFAYIRDLIGKELRYPRQAIRMGWSGRVTVSFLVLVDGSVTELRVNHGSGVPLLDRNALETVERAAPFPRPPVSARLVMPVDYILE